jgi:hypothetical protein
MIKSENDVKNLIFDYTKNDGMKCLQSVNNNKMKTQDITLSLQQI